MMGLVRVIMPGRMRNVSGRFMTQGSHQALTAADARSMKFFFTVHAIWSSVVFMALWMAMSLSLPLSEPLWSLAFQALTFGAGINIVAAIAAQWTIRIALHYFIFYAIFGVMSGLLFMGLWIDKLSNPVNAYGPSDDEIVFSFTCLLVYLFVPSSALAVLYRYRYVWGFANKRANHEPSGDTSETPSRPWYAHPLVMNLYCAGQTVYWFAVLLVSGYFLIGSIDQDLLFSTILFGLLTPGAGLSVIASVTAFKRVRAAMNFVAAATGLFSLYGLWSVLTLAYAFVFRPEYYQDSPGSGLLHFIAVIGFFAVPAFFLSFHYYCRHYWLAPTLQADPAKADP